MTNKRVAQKEIDQQLKDFIDNGGSIEQVETGVGGTLKNEPTNIPIKYFRNTKWIEDRKDDK